MTKIEISRQDIKDVEIAIQTAHALICGQTKEFQDCLDRAGIKTNNCFSAILALLFYFYYLHKTDLYSDKTATRITALKTLLKKIQHKNCKASSRENEELDLTKTELEMLSGSLVLYSSILRNNLDVLEDYIVWAHSSKKERFGGKIINGLQTTIENGMITPCRQETSNKCMRFSNELCEMRKPYAEDFQHKFPARL